jgi:hypothetical protein
MPFPLKGRGEGAGVKQHAFGWSYTLRIMQSHGFRHPRTSPQTSIVPSHTRTEWPPMRTLSSI